MRKIIASTFVSLDGVMQAPGGPEEDPTGGFAYGGWSFNYWDGAMMEIIGKSMSDPFDLLLGRKTYEVFAAHWPYVANDPIADKFNATTKYVATSSTAPLSWKNSVAIRGDVAAGIAKLKQGEGPDLLIQGSSQLIQALLANELIDEFRIWTFPLVLGSGKRLFEDGAAAAAMKLVDSSTSSTGVTISTYVLAGDINPGSFALQEPNEAELARREKMKREG
jgi:dihydrofolate reductase